MVTFVRGFLVLSVVVLAVLALGASAAPTVSCGLLTPPPGAEVWCLLFANLIMPEVIAQAVLLLTSAILDKIPAWRTASGDFKRVIWAVLSAALPALAWWLGATMGCEKLPSFAEYLFVGLSAALAIMLNDSLHQSRKAAEYPKGRLV